MTPKNWPEQFVHVGKVASGSIPFDSRCVRARVVTELSWHDSPAFAHF